MCGQESLTWPNQIIWPLFDFAFLLKPNSMITVIDFFNSKHVIVSHLVVVGRVLIMKWTNLILYIHYHGYRFL